MKENGLEVVTDGTKHMVLSQDQSVGRNKKTKIYNSACARVEDLKCLGTTRKNPKSIQQEIKRRLNSGNVCFHSV